MSKKIEEVAYHMISCFLSALNQKDLESLKQFRVTGEVLEEIMEVLDSYFYDEKINLSPPPREIAFTQEEPWELFSIYGDDEGTCWRIECRLFNNGIESEAELTVDLILESDGSYLLKYCGIGS